MNAWYEAKFSYARECLKVVQDMTDEEAFNYWTENFYPVSKSWLMEMRAK